MSEADKQIAAGQFKAKCLGLLDEVAQTGRPLVVTRRGKPVAKVVPVRDRAPRSLKGSILWQGDVISPIDERWNAES